MPLTNYALDKYVGQGFSSLKMPNTKSVRGEFPNLDSWIPIFIRQSIFHRNLSDDRKAFAFALIRRAQAAIEDYDEACVTLTYIIRGENIISKYFHALRKIESSVAQLYQAFDFARKALSQDIFEKNDGTVIQRLNSIYNDSRHPDVTKLPPGHLQPVWIHDDGFCTINARLGFDEFESLLRLIGKNVDRISNGDAYTVPSRPS